MKPLYLIIIAILFAACQKSVPVDIAGTTILPDGSIITIKNDADSTLASGVVNQGKFEIAKANLEPGYYTFSVKKLDERMDYEVYLEPGKYTISTPKEDGEYLHVKTSSVTQNKLSDYYSFEDSVLYKFRQEVIKTTTAISDPKNAKISEADFQKLVSDQNSAKARVNGATVAAINLYIDKHPQTDIILHIISNMDYHADPVSYQIVFNRLSRAVKNSAAGKELQSKLQGSKSDNTPRAVPAGG